MSRPPFFCVPPITPPHPFLSPFAYTLSPSWLGFQSIDRLAMTRVLEQEGGDTKGALGTMPRIRNVIREIESELKALDSQCLF